MELDYSDERKALAHDRDRYAWEHESGWGYAMPDESTEMSAYDAMDTGYEQGFSRGWDAAMNRNWITRLLNKLNKKENN